MSLLTNFIVAHKMKFITVVALAAIAYCSTFFLGNDNPIEQGAESEIKRETGIDIDFSPNQK